MDPEYEADEEEVRVLFGLYLKQKRNGALIDKELLSNIVSKGKVRSFFFIQANIKTLFYLLLFLISKNTKI